MPNIEKGSKAQATKDIKENTSKLPPVPETVIDETKDSHDRQPMLTALRDFNAKNADQALITYIRQMMAGSEKEVNRETAKKQIISTALFSAIAMIDIGLMFLFHRLYGLLIPILIADLVIMLIRFKRINPVRSTLAKIISMPDTDMESIIASEKQNSISVIKVTLQRLAIVSVMILLLAVTFWEPRMIFESNATGVGLRYYSASIVHPNPVVIPETWNGKKVTEIRGNVFMNLGALRQIVLPSGITEIRASTFENSGLTQIDIPTGVTRIAAHAFRHCGSLRRVTVPDTVMSIGSSAFRECDSLYQIELPKGCSYDLRSFKDSPTKLQFRQVYGQ